MASARKWLLHGKWLLPRMASPQKMASPQNGFSPENGFSTKMTSPRKWLLPENGFSPKRASPQKWLLPKNDFSPKDGVSTENGFLQKNLTFLLDLVFSCCVVFTTFLYDMSHRPPWRIIIVKQNVTVRMCCGSRCVTCL